jgi:hypothetical protein
MAIACECELNWSLDLIPSPAFTTRITAHPTARIAPAIRVAMCSPPPCILDVRSEVASSARPTGVELSPLASGEL